MTATPRDPPRSTRLMLWVLLRLPLLGVLGYPFRDRGLTLVEWIVGDVGRVTMLAIAVLSTLPARLVLGLGVFLFLGVTLDAAARWLGEMLRLLVPAVLLGAGLLLLFRWLTPPVAPPLVAAAVTGVLLVNTVPALQADFPPARWSRGRASLTLALLVGLEVVAPVLVWAWLRNTAGAVGGRARSAGPGSRWAAAAVVALFAAVPYGHAGLEPLSARVARDARVQRLASGDFNWLALDTAGRTLYASGRGTTHVLAFDVGAQATPARPVRQSAADTGRAQAFFYDAPRGRIYVHNPRTQTLLVLDAETLALVRSFPTPEMAPGDSLIEYDARSDALILASEADAETGVALAFLNRLDGTVRDSQGFAVSHLVLHPVQPWLYLSFFRRGSDLVVYDMAQREVVRRRPGPDRLDRMVLRTATNELLVASPLDSAVLRYHADTLQPLGQWDTVFGVRTIALDTQRGLLLAGSLVSTALDVIDLASGRSVDRFRVAPQLRTLALDVPRGLAYVSAVTGIFVIRYASAGSPGLGR